MFTGIVETVGRVSRVERAHAGVRLTLTAGQIAEDVQLGDSVSVSGICLTVTEIRPPQITFDAVYETLRKTTLGELQPGSIVNLERALPVTGRLGGHIMQGHVDGTGRIASIRSVGNSWFVYVDAASELMRYIVTKGSVAIDGISLTVAESEDKTFALSIIPHTWEHTTLKDKRAGDAVNIECDILGKYVEKLLGGYLSVGQEPVFAGERRTGVTMDLLTRSGYVNVATAVANDGDGGGRW